MKNKKPLLFLIFLCVLFITNAGAQDSYNVHTLGYYILSVEYLKTGDYDNAIANSNMVIRRDPNSAIAYMVRARAYYEKGDMPNAISDSTQAIRLDNRNISAFSIRASAYARTGNNNRAISDWQAVLRLNPENADAQRNIELARARQ